MWFLIKSIAGTLMLLFLAYTVFFIDLGGKTFAGHFADVWESPTLQQKVDMVRDGVRNELEDRLAEAAERHTRKMVRESLDGDGSADAGRRTPRGSEREEITEADRESLAKMIVAH